MLNKKSFNGIFVSLYDFYISRKLEIIVFFVKKNGSRSGWPKKTDPDPQHWYLGSCCLFNLPS